MQVVETNVEGLKRQLRVVVEAGEINERFSTRLDEIKGRHHSMLVDPGHAASAEYRRFWSDLAAGRE